jgi:hypothetical protein
MKRVLLLEEEEARLRRDIERDRDLIDGAIVRQPFSCGERMVVGSRMSREEIRKMPTANFEVMNGKYFRTFGS